MKYPPDGIFPQLAEMATPKHYDRLQIRARMTMSDCIEAMRLAFLDLDASLSEVPERAIQTYRNGEIVQLMMPVVLRDIDLITTKLVTVHPKNAATNLPLIHATILAQKASTGEVLATIDGSEITAMRTAAVSALATQWLSREEADTLALFGTGVQSASHLEAMAVVRPIKRVLIFGRSPQKAERFANEQGEVYDLDIQPVADLNTLKLAHIICTCSTSNDPLFSIENIGEGVHINAVGAFQLESRELSSDIVANARVVIDQWEGCRKEAGDIMIPIGEGLFDKSHIEAELGSLIGENRPFVRDTGDITVFKSVGNAIEDAYACAVVLEMT